RCLSVRTAEAEGSCDKEGHYLHCGTAKWLHQVSPLSYVMILWNDYGHAHRINLRINDMREMKVMAAVLSHERVVQPHQTTREAGEGRSLFQPSPFVQECRDQLERGAFAHT